MTQHVQDETSYLSQLRLLLEELCCDLCRFEHVAGDGLRPEDVRIDREYSLRRPGAFADIRIVPAALPPYAVEIKYGYSTDMLLRHLKRKYGERSPALDGIQKLILVLDWDRRVDRQALEADIRACLCPGLALEIWDEQRLVALLRERFRVEITEITADNLLDVRQAIDRTKGYYAFGGASFEEYDHDPLKAEMLWHLGFWRLQQLRSAGRASPREILPPGLYRRVVVLLGDLCSFSSYVRDTPDAGIVRESLTSFYSRARYQIINNGGMLYQFVGDEVIGFFGVPAQSNGDVAAALQTARCLLSIGESVSHHWQRRIDRVQASRGLHIGIALGDLQLVSLRPFSRTHMGAIGDCINVAARLMAAAGPGEIVVSNAFHQGLDEESQAGFAEVEPIEARNVGRIRAWKMRDPAPSP
ncbi:MAG: adenylate/guanylate cyclase domain-containing protein [Gemmataceae bacterium]